MSTNQLKYKVFIREYANRHYIKTFEKKYGRYWDMALEAIVESLERVDTFLTTSKAEKILSYHEKNAHILKCEFRLANSSDSAHASGNRYIVYFNESLRECHVLLLYSKDHYEGQETSWWKQQIKTNYPDMREIFLNL